MQHARTLLEKLLCSLATHISQARPITKDETPNGHGKPGDVTSFQAAFNLLLRAIICHLLDSTALPDQASATFILSQSNKLLEGLSIIPYPASHLDHLVTQVNAKLDKSAITAVADALQNESEDIIGDTYTSLVPQDIRRPLGQFWTPPPIARLMTQWAIRSPHDSVLDPAFGSGVLLITAADRLIHLGALTESTMRQVSGVELCPLAFLMGLTNLLLRHAPYVPRLKWDDFIAPARGSDAMLRERAATYEVTPRQMILPGMENVAPTVLDGLFDSIVCNPPYTRHHHLPEAYKSSWTRLIEQEYGVRLSRFSSLFAYFFIQASKMLSPTGRMAFITPVTVFEANYSKQLKSFIRQHLRLRALITFDESFPVFEGVDTAACITLIEGTDAPSMDQVLHMHIHQWPGVEQVLQVIERKAPPASKWASCHEIDVSTLKTTAKWTVMPHTNTCPDNDHFVPLASIARVMRGIATGANKFFVLSDEEIARWGLNQDELRPVLTKTREVPGYIFTSASFEQLGREGKKRWLLYLTKPVKPGTAEARYIRYGEALGLHERSLVRTRPLWYIMEQRRPAPIYFTYLSRRRPRFIYNKTDTLALNVFLCIYPNSAISQDETLLKALLAVLNSIVARESLRRVGRSYGGDTIKIEPREMDHLPILNPETLATKEQQALAQLFDELCNAESEKVEQTICRAIDELMSNATKNRGPYE